MIRRFDIIVHGKVQGVGFRYSANIRAKSLKLKGWAENWPDGTVHTTVQGDDASCQTYIQWCREGPEFSRVEKIEVTEQPPSDMAEFSVRC